MYNDYINEIISEKKEYYFILIFEYVRLYLKSLLIFYNNQDNRSKLTNIIKKYLRYTKKECELLKRIKNIEHKEEYEDKLSKILEDLETYYVQDYYFLENILSGYEKAFDYRDILYSNFKDKEFNIDYLEECFKKIKGM